MSKSTSGMAATLGPSFRAARHGTGLFGPSTRGRGCEVIHSTLSRWEREEHAISFATYEHLSMALAAYMDGRWEA